MGKNKKRIPEKKAQEDRLRTTHIASATYQGPLPPPQLLESYNNVVPNAAERIIAMAESQASHRQELESIAIKAGARDSLLGLISAFILGFSAIASGTYCTLKGMPIGGSIQSGVGLVSLVGVFIYGSRQRRKEREMKNEALRRISAR
jgi:uncharacterized membrane protein